MRASDGKDNSGSEDDAGAAGDEKQPEKPELKPKKAKWFDRDGALTRAMRRVFHLHCIRALCCK